MNGDRTARASWATAPPSCRGVTRRAALSSGLAALGSATLPVAVRAQGFAGLGTVADGFAVPERTTRLTFPRDHGAHPSFRIEWWYLTCNLTGEDGAEYGIQWTLFRSALRPPPYSGEGWQSPQLWLAHAGLTTETRHFHAERLARGGIGQAGVTTDPFSAWLDEWHLATPEADPTRSVALTSANRRADALDRVQVHAAGADFAYSLRADAEGPLVLQGDRGYSVKSPEGQASHYYSQPFYRMTGTLTLPDGPVPVRGQGWLDREWSSQPLSDSQDGWDWISLHLDTGEKLMGFRLRDRARAPFTSATHVAPDGTATAQTDGALTLTPRATSRVAGRDVPTSWHVHLPAHGIDVDLEAIYPQAWMETTFPYWEGPVRIAGSHGGRGYLEMTGYAEV